MYLGAFCLFVIIWSWKTAIPYFAFSVVFVIVIVKLPQVRHHIPVDYDYDNVSHPYGSISYVAAATATNLMTVIDFANDGPLKSTIYCEGEIVDDR